MIELLKTNDPVLISFVQTILTDAGIDALVLDTHASILEGSASAIPRRVMVLDEDLETAKQILKTREAELNGPRILD